MKVDVEPGSTVSEGGGSRDQRRDAPFGIVNVPHCFPTFRDFGRRWPQWWYIGHARAWLLSLKK